MTSRKVHNTNRHTSNPGLHLFNRSSYRPPLASCATGLLQPSVIKTFTLCICTHCLTHTKHSHTYKYCFEYEAIVKVKLPHQAEVEHTNLLGGKICMAVDSIMIRNFEVIGYNPPPRCVIFISTTLEGTKRPRVECL